MLIRYWTGCDYVTCWIEPIGAAQHIEKLKGIGMTHIRVYKAACYCNAGVRVISEDGTEEPCTECQLGRQYEALYYPDRVIPY